MFTIEILKIGQPYRVFTLELYSDAYYKGSSTYTVAGLIGMGDREERINNGERVVCEIDEIVSIAITKAYNLGEQVRERIGGEIGKIDDIEQFEGLPMYSVRFPVGRWAYRAEQLQPVSVESMAR